MITVKFVKEVWSGRRLYKLSESVETETGETTEYVVISAISRAFDTGRPETFIFPANRKGEITDWQEMKGSIQGVQDFDVAIRNAGWSVG
jgi:hypothetical protein